MLSLEANRNYSGYLASHASQDASSLESADSGITVLFHQPHFVWENESPFAFDTGSRQPLPTGPCSSVARFISPAALCLGTRVCSPLTPEAANSCQRALAAPSPNLFHQPHFVWEQNSPPLGRRYGWTYI